MKEISLQKILKSRLSDKKCGNILEELDKNTETYTEMVEHILSNYDEKDSLMLMFAFGSYLTWKHIAQTKMMTLSKLAKIMKDINSEDSEKDENLH